MGQIKNIKLHIVTDIKIISNKQSIVSKNKIPRKMPKLPLPPVLRQNAQKMAQKMMETKLFQQAMEQVTKNYYYGVFRPWVRTGATWGAAGGALALILAEPRFITEKIPFYSRKYKHEIPK